MPQQWFVKTSKGQAGPFSSGKLRQLVADGKIKPSSSVSPDGKKWVKAQSIKGLSFPSVDEEPPRLGGATLGFPETSTLPFVEQREAEYIRRFGPYSQVYHELQPIIPHIDVYVHPPHGDRDYTTLITSGMSDNPMPVPPGAGSPRAELVLYVAEATELCVNLLRFLAQLPYKQNIWYSYGSTMTNGQPLQPIFDGSVLDCYVFIPPIIDSDYEICESAAIADAPLQVLWVVPITSAERQLVMDRGIDDFFELLNKHQHPLVVDQSRKCYVNRKRWFGL